MPITLPTGWELGNCLVQFVGIDEELNGVRAQLLNTQLGSFHQNVASATVQFPWQYLQRKSQFICVNLYIITSVNFHPLIVSFQIQHMVLLVLDQTGATHQMYRCGIRRSIL